MKDDDLLYVLPSVAVSVFASLTKSIHYPLFQSRETVLKSYSEGLYHITSDEAADKIIESQELYASSRFDSYGFHKRCFFFGGVPDFENVCLNVNPSITLTAVRVMLPYEKLAEFDRRGMNDGAITYKGNLSLEGARVEKVRLGLKEKDGELYYDQISEEEYQNYNLDLSDDKQKIVCNKLAFKIKGYMAGMRREFELFKQNMGNVFHDVVYDESSGITWNTRDSYLEKNSDLLENTAEIPVVEISQEEEIINMYNSLMDNNTQIYQVGGVIFNDKNDVKAELLKSVVSNVVISLQAGVLVGSNDMVIKPTMNDKDISDVLYRNLCFGKVEECYNLLDNSFVLYSVCRSYVQNKSKRNENDMYQDPRIQFLNQDIDNFNFNIKQNKTEQIGF